MNLGPSNLRSPHWQKKAKEAAGSKKPRSKKRTKVTKVTNQPLTPYQNSMADFVRELRDRGIRCPYCLDGPGSSETWWKTDLELEEHLLTHGFAAWELPSLAKEQPQLSFKKNKKRGRKARNKAIHQSAYELKKLKSIDLKCHYCVAGSIEQNLVFSGVHELRNHLVTYHGQLLKKAELLAMYEARRQAQSQSGFDPGDGD